MATRSRGSIVARGEGRWLVRITRGSGETRYTENRTVRGLRIEAQKFLTERLRQLDGGQPLGLSRQTLGEWLDEYLQNWSARLKPSTLRAYQEALRLYLPAGDRLRLRRLVDLTVRDYQGWIKALAERVSPSTVSHVHRIVRTALGKALHLGLVQRNVAASADLPRQSRREYRVLTAAQAQHLLEVASGTPYEALWTLLLTAGIRPGEALALQWADLEGATLRVQRAVIRIANRKPKWTIAETKTGRGREVILPNITVHALKAHRVRQLVHQLKLGALFEDQGLIFPNDRGGLLDRYNVIARHFKPLLRRAGLPEAIRLYDLRHSCASLLLAAGEHPKIVQERLGHASIQRTLDTYSHLVPGLQLRAAEKLETLLTASQPAASTEAS